MWRRCASADRGPAGIEGLRAPGERATEGRCVPSEDTFLTLGMQRWRIGMQLRNAHRVREELVDGRTLLERAYSVDNRPPVRRLGERAIHRRLTRAASLFVISLSSIGLWIAICGALTAVLR
jgi:hypothetical protein